MWEIPENKQCFEKNTDSPSLLSVHFLSGSYES